MIDWIRNLPPYLIILLAAGTLIAFVFVIFLIYRAFREGREISFWPPRVGPRIDEPTLTGKQRVSSAASPYDLQRVSEVETQFDVDYDIVLEFNNVPSVVVNSEQHVYRFWVDVFVTSYCNYELTISSGRCETRIDAQGFINITENSPLSLKPRKRQSYHFEKELTDGEVRRTLLCFGDATERRVQFEFHLSLSTPFSVHQIHRCIYGCATISKHQRRDE
jgi:hypothetical protein